MMKTKRHLCLLLVLFMTAGMLFSGCAGQEKEKTGTETAGKNAATTTEQGETDGKTTSEKDNGTDRTDETVHTASGDTEPGETEPKETEPKETEPGETEPKETEPKDTGKKEETIVKEETAPVDRSVCEISPRIVRTKGATDDVVVASIIVTDDGYAVDPTGKYDSTAGIQKALKDCSVNGGGTVFLPAGTYTVTGPITVPAFVTLRGDYIDPDMEKGNGTLIRVDIRDWRPKDGNNPFNEGTFYLGGSGGVNGLTVYYPHQSLNNVKQYAPTFYTDGLGNNYMASNVQNCTVINGYIGIGACCNPNTIHEQLGVVNFKGTFLYTAAMAYNQADVGTWQEVTVSPRYWANAEIDGLPKVSLEDVAGYTRENTTGLTLGDLEWTEFEKLTVESCRVGILIDKGKRIEFAGSLHGVSVTDCNTGLLVNSLDTRWGLVLSDSVIEGSIHNKTAGVVKLCGVTVKGQMIGNIIKDNTDVSGYAVDITRTYRKPKEQLYVAIMKKGVFGECSGPLQEILDEAGKTGGIVYVPGGTYYFSGPVTVPAGVELRGTGDGVNRDQSGSAEGTLFLCSYGDGTEYGEKSPAFITLAGDNAGLNGIRILFQKNGPADSDLHTCYAVRGLGKGNYIVSASIGAADYGIDFRGCDDHLIQKVSICCYTTSMRLGGKNGAVIGCLQNGTVIVRTPKGAKNWISEGDVFSKLFDPITRVQSTMLLLEGAHGEQIVNTFCYGCLHFMRCKASDNVIAVNVGSDNLGGAQFVMEGGSFTGVNIMRWNGSSYDYKSGSMQLFNRLTINEKNEETLIR